MAVDLADFIETLKREITPLGTAPYTAVTDVAWVGYLSDAFWEARLDGFMPGYICDEDGSISPVATGTVELDRKNVALIVIYAGIRVLRNKILNTNTQFRAKAGSVEFEQQNSATMLAEMLRQLKDTRDRIIYHELLQGTDAYLLDAYSTRMFWPTSYYGSINFT